MATVIEGSGLAPMTYAEALDMYRVYGHRPFSFVTAPYDILKTVQSDADGRILASPPSAYNATDTRRMKDLRRRGRRV